MKHFLPQLSGATVDILLDNATTVAFIKKEGVTQSASLCRLALQVWAGCREHPVASHFSGVHSVQGKHHHPTEWSMHKVKVALMFEHWPTPHVDLFASEMNHKLPVFFSARPSPTSSGLNALTQNWEHLYGYAFPPFSFILRVLNKLRLQSSAYWWRRFGPVNCGSIS